MPAPTPEVNTPQVEQRWIGVARLLRPQGRRGELLAEPLTDLADVFTPGRVLRLEAAPGHKGAPPTLTLEDRWSPTGRNAGRLVLKLAGIDSINAAEAFEGAELLLAEADLPALAEDTYLVRDLVGCTLFSNTDELGTIVDLQFPVGPDGRTRLPDAVDLLVLHPLGVAPEAEPALVPFVKAWLTSVDIPSKRIVMDLPPGLFDATVEADPTSE